MMNPSSSNRPRRRPATMTDDEDPSNGTARGERRHSADVKSSVLVTTEESCTKSRGKHMPVNLLSSAGENDNDDDSSASMASSSSVSSSSSATTAASSSSGGSLKNDTDSSATSSDKTLTENHGGTKAPDCPPKEPRIQKQPTDRTTQEENKNASSNSKSASLKLFLLGLMVVQNSSVVLVARYTRRKHDSNEKEQYSINHVIVVTEVAKLFVSLVMEAWTCRRHHNCSASSGSTSLWHSLQQHVLHQPWDAYKVMVPALLYLVQSTLLLTALSNLSAPLFQVTYQGKLVATALVSTALLKNRRYTQRQWICLLALSIGVAIVAWGQATAAAQSRQQTAKEGNSSSSSSNNNNLFVGLSAVAAACFSSALAGVYFEKVLKHNKNNNQQQNQSIAPPPSLWMRNIQLACFSVMIALMQGYWKEPQQDSGGEPRKPYLLGFTTWTWVLVALQAAGGLLVAAVMKHADNVLKGLATGVSVVVSSFLSHTTTLFSEHNGTQSHNSMSLPFVCGSTLILLGVGFFNVSGAAATSTTAVVDTRIGSKRNISSANKKNIGAISRHQKRKQKAA